MNLIDLPASTVGLIVVVLAVVTALLCALMLALALRLRRVERHYRRLTTGVEGGSLQALLEQHVARVEAATVEVAALQVGLKALQMSTRRLVQSPGFLRYNPFRETGGDQSFVLALCDADGNGVVVTSLHSRDVTRIYGKPLAAWQSSYPLGEEEQQAIERARRGV